MKRLKEEAANNFAKFTADWQKKLETIMTSLDTEEARYRESYLRLISLQAWRSEVLERLVPEDALAFFLEAQNDAVLSHVLARMGCWRIALKCLRSCIENTFQCLYYKDHGIELTLWGSGNHRLGRAALQNYLETHPDVRGLDLNTTGIPVLAAEYETLSKAVHASAKSFRMTADGGSTRFFTDDKASLGPWQTRERQVMAGLNQLLTTVFRAELEGAKVPNLRKAVSLAIPQSRHAQIKTVLKVNLYAS